MLQNNQPTRKKKELTTIAIKTHHAHQCSNRGACLASRIRAFPRPPDALIQHDGMVDLLKISRVAARRSCLVRPVGFAALVLSLRVLIVGTLLLAMGAEHVARAGLRPNRSRQGAAWPAQREATNRPRATGRRGDGRQWRPAGGAELERGHVDWRRGIVA
jgi:hypothetical protein